jgi:hypothetical protein
MKFQKVICFVLPLRSLVTCKYVQIRFLGGKLGEAIANEYDVSTVGDLLCVTNIILVIE